MTSERTRQVGRWIIEVVVVLAIVMGVRAYMTRGAISGPAPALDERAIDGARVSLGAMRGRPVLVHFWATWCGVCRAQESNIASLAQDHDVITIAVRSGREPSVQRELRERGLTFPVVVDPSARIAGAWGVRAFPTDFVVAPDGEIAFTEAGYTTTLGLRFRLWASGVL